MVSTEPELDSAGHPRRDDPREASQPISPHVKRNLNWVPWMLALLVFLALLAFGMRT